MAVLQCQWFISRHYEVVYVEALLATGLECHRDSLKKFRLITKWGEGDYIHISRGAHSMNLNLFTEAAVDPLETLGQPRTGQKGTKFEPAAQNLASLVGCTESLAEGERIGAVGRPIGRRSILARTDGR